MTENEKTGFDIDKIIEVLFSGLSEREKGILLGRYALEGGKIKTLEEIGKQFGVTRERIRQIETATIKKLKNKEGVKEVLEPLKGKMKDVLTQFGGLMHPDFLVGRIVEKIDQLDQQKNALMFVLRHFVNDEFKFHEEKEDIHSSWRLPEMNHQIAEDVIGALHSLFEKRNEPIVEEEIQKYFKNHSAKLSDHPDVTKNMLISLLELSKYLEKNVYQEWGKKDWNTVSPKKMNDKIYLVLKKEGKPMHFVNIAEKINETFQDKKKAFPATIHNELILDQKYVLVGRGIYALQEWGYKPGVVADVVESVLKKAGKPLTKQEIIEEVQKERIVKKSTIILALMNKERFKKTENGAYFLAE